LKYDWQPFVGLPPGAPTIAKTQEAVGPNEPPAERVLTTTYQILRDTEIARKVKAWHRFECQLCGFTISLPDGTRYAEAHHLQPLGHPHGGPDIIDNVICVCPNHHAQLDLGAIEITLSSLRSVESHTINPKFVDYHNRKVQQARKV
jgi:predicted restriction endonuclease